ncbi:hypothetical protein CMI37_27060 [Candidatus Pacearchaeota archaeon]|nr:hypothetical protein [Candidatus Pacearchaeota archaeon]|tara:strand:+ start:2564 stop:2899 length:336 start_codon:yes stop_codon:yes gene_type:complete
MAERKLLWYRLSSAVPERHRYNFLIINDPREIGIIKQKLYEQLKPVIEEKTIEEGVVEGLHFKLLDLETTASKVDFSKVYKGKVRQDRRLRPRGTSGGWNDFVNLIASGRI